jgi:23S rRNA (guanosine2251-2'-O)-methyltransferase
MPEIYVVLHDIRSSENVGSIFRTADAAGVSKLYLSGYTPTPLDRFGRKNARLAKASLGAETSVPWESREDAGALVASLKERGVSVVSVEQSPRSIPYDDFDLERPTAFVFGNEVSGVPEDLLRVSDAILEIPMRGKKESLNVSVAAGIVLFAVQ